MPDAKTLKALYNAVNDVEYALAQVGDDLLFQVKPEGGLEVVCRGPDGLAAESLATVVNIGADPLLWQAARPEGAVTLGQPYRDPEPRCALSRQPLSGAAPVDLYYRGQPVAAEHVLTRFPRLVFLQSLMVFLGALTSEAWARLAPAAEVGAAPEATPETAARALWIDFLAQLPGVSPTAAKTGRDQDPDPEDPPEES